MTVLFNCITQFSEELWKAGVIPVISMEEMSVRSICRRQATTPVAAFTTPMAIIVNIHDSILSNPFPSTYRKSKLVTQRIFSQISDLSRPWFCSCSLPFSFPVAEAAKFNFACPFWEYIDCFVWELKHIHEQLHQSIEPVRNESF